MDFCRSFLAPLIETKNYNVLPLAGDASSRRYYRVVSEEQSWVLMQWDPFSEPEKFPFLSVQSFFDKNGIRVPQVLGFSEKEGLFLLEDLGDLTLERRFWEFQNQENALPFYEKTLDQLIKIHSLSFENRNQGQCTAFEIEFSVEKLLWELNYAKKHLLQGVLKLNLSPLVETELEKEFTEICTRLYQSPQVICHRDFHSRNVMISYNEFAIIDFQDARLGPPVYDLVSLFYDSYVELNDQSIGHLMNYYKTNFPYFSKFKLSESQWQELFDLQSIQRCFKACGSFASFKMTRDDNRYLHYIKPTTERVLTKLNLFPEMKTLKTILTDSRDRWEAIC